jgi:hypothetical protein
MNGHVGVVKMLLEVDPKPNIDAQEEEGWTALHFAAMNGHVGVVKMLLEADPKPNIDVREEEGRTALHFAAMNEHMGVMKMLLEADPKPNIDAQDKFGSTALHCVLQGHQNYQVINLLARATYASSSQHISFPEHPANDVGNIVDLVESLIQLDSNDGRLRRCLGYEYMRLNRYKEASEAFDMSMYLKMTELKVTRVEDIIAQVYCDHCTVRTSIIGRYYKCIQCSWDYDLCQACFQKWKHPHPSTDLIMIPSEQFMAERDLSFGYPVPLF